MTIPYLCFNKRYAPCILFEGESFVAVQRTRRALQNFFAASKFRSETTKLISDFFIKLQSWIYPFLRLILSDKLSFPSFEVEISYCDKRNIFFSFL